MPTVIYDVLKAYTINADGDAKSIVYTEFYKGEVTDGAFVGVYRQQTDRKFVGSPNQITYNRNKTMDSEGGTIYDEITFGGLGSSATINTNDFNIQTGVNFTSGDIDGIENDLKGLIVIK